MDELFGEIMGCKFGSDSILLGLLRSAMDKAHENVQSTDGSIELLNARSQFYELAMILVEGCSKLIEEKAEIPETNREKMLLDLMESRDMVKGRLEELKLGIVEKDRELMERLESESKLRLTLELKERELVSLRAKIELERTKSEVPVFLNDQGNGYEEKEGIIVELKNSVDQQVWSIKQKIEDERISLTNGGSEDFELTPMNQLSRPEQNIVVFEQMSSDIDGLKGTLDLAFGRMQNAEMRPLEKQWRWAIEKDTMLVLIRGFRSNLKHNFEAELTKRVKQVVPTIGFLSQLWPELIHEITCLHQQLEALCCPNEVEVKRVVKNQESLESSSSIHRTISEPLPEFNYVEEPQEEGDHQGSHYVAKMIKNHESIIRKQREELNWLKREILREKESLSIKRLKDHPNNLETRIQQVITKLGKVIEWNAQIDNNKGVHGIQNFQDKETTRADGFVDFGEIVGSDSDLNDEVKKLQQERDDSSLETMMMEETYVILFKGLVKDFYLESQNYEIESLMRNDISMYFLRETVNEWNLISSENKSFEIQVGEEVCYTLCSNIAKDFWCNDQGFNSQEYQGILTETIECTLKEDIYMVLFRETIKEWEMERDSNNLAHLITEDIYHLVMDEAVKDACFLGEFESLNSLEVVNLIKKLVSLFKCFELEEDLILDASSEIKEHSANNDLVASECEEVDVRGAIEWLLTGEKSTFNSVGSKLEKALQQLFVSRALLKDSLSIAAAIENVHEREHSFCQTKDNNQILQLNSSDSMLSPLRGFQQMLVDFEYMVHQKLEMNFQRLENLANQMHQLIQLVASLRKNELLYRMAFSRRCHNLQLAETEVDMLGDQVELLLGLLEKIYSILDQYSPVLSCYFGVSDILKLIKKELGDAAILTIPVSNMKL